MRIKLRIPIILEKMLISDRLKKFLKTENQYIINLIYDNWTDITQEWNRYPDYRFGQLLSNLNLVDKNIEDCIWNIEEDNWLVENGYIKFEEIKFWGINYYKNNKRRKNTKYKLLKDLDLDHIKNIIIFFEERASLNKLETKYLEYFNNRIKLNE